MEWKSTIPLVLFLLILISGCSEEPITYTEANFEIQPSIKEEKPETRPTAEASPTTVEKKTERENITPTGWHYQLQNAEIDELKRINENLLVVDIDDLYRNGEKFENLKQNKLVLSYLSIGEAEDYRTYWVNEWTKEKPDWILEENREWEGNHKIEYWRPIWHSIMVSQTIKIMHAEYDGIYLDLVDAYQYFEKNENYAKNEMVELIKLISSKAKELNPDAIVIIQNGVELYPLVAESIDGIAKEDLWFDENEEQEKSDTRFALNILTGAKENGKIVLSIDYPTDEYTMCQYYKKCREQEFLCTVSNKYLTKNAPLFPNSFDCQEQSN